MMGQLFSTKGQFWSSGLIGNDPPPNQSSFESTLGYIPTLSLSHNLTDNQFIDIDNIKKNRIDSKIKLSIKFNFATKIINNGLSNSTG